MGKKEVIKTRKTGLAGKKHKIGTGDAECEAEEGGLT
jgi:hypothetical protein